MVGLTDAWHLNLAELPHHAHLIAHVWPGGFIGCITAVQVESLFYLTVRSPHNFGPVAELVTYLYPLINYSCFIVRTQSPGTSKLRSALIDQIVLKSSPYHLRSLESL